MQIDGHHTLTYIAARIAGFDKSDAEIIAYSAQYVDDATNSGVIRFDNGAMYSRISSAHKLLDYRNTQDLANHRVWVPFHFLPGNGDKPAGENPEGSFINKLLCYPDSHIARDMLRFCIEDRNKRYALHRLGITMHVYADTWSHQGFAGVIHKINNVENLNSNNKSLDKIFLDKIKSYFVNEGFPLGHGAALKYPDLPYLEWEYQNGFEELKKRNNPENFLEATDRMCRAMQCFLKSDFKMDIDSMPGLPIEDKKIIDSLLKSIKDDSGEERHKKWLKEIEKGSFSFGAETIQYIAKGEDSWKFLAIGQLKDIDSGDEVFEYKESFLSSNWKLFHDALQAHRFDILHDILPKYGICAA